MLFFELFPAVFAVVALIVGVMLYAVNRQAARETESPRAPSMPDVTPGSEVNQASGNARRPSMRA